MRMIFISLGVALIFISCSKYDSHAPTITISSPQDNQTFSAGQPVNISASIADSSKINEVHVRVTNLSTGVEFIHLDQLIDVTTFQYHNSFTAEKDVSYTIEVEANNYRGNDAQVYVHIQGQ